ncbi:MAG: hypothetical protein QXG00_03705 [Candidatus Woesearchaeota archaeon]
MLNYLEPISFGFLGGIVRAIVGILKYRKTHVKFVFLPGRFLFTIIASGIIGVFVALLIANDYRIALLSGYAGTDIIEGIYKSFKKKIV